MCFSAGMNSLSLSLSLSAISIDFSDHAVPQPLAPHSQFFHSSLLQQFLQTIHPKYPPSSPTASSPTPSSQNFPSKQDSLGLLYV